jgi:cholest-4-en-3-one 26-monooxygenase
MSRSLPSGFDLIDPDTFEHGVPLDRYAELRRTAPVWWSRPREPRVSPTGGSGRGFHFVSTARSRAGGTWNCWAAPTSSMRRWRSWRNGRHCFVASKKH